MIHLVTSDQDQTKTKEWICRSTASPDIVGHLGSATLMLQKRPIRSKLFRSKLPFV
jgi:hypothetical protein